MLLLPHLVEEAGAVLRGAILKWIGRLLRIGMLVIAALFVVNATDDALSEEAQAALRIPQPPSAREANGFLDFLALGATAEAPTYATGLKQLNAYREQVSGRVDDTIPSVKLDARLPDCRRGAFLPCVTGALAQPPFAELIESHGVFLARYRAMREKPEFIDLLGVLTSPDDGLRSYRELVIGSRLALLRAAVQFNAGERAQAINELEAEFAFHRKVAAGSRSLLPKLVAFSMLDGAAVFASELARELAASDKALWKRLEAATRLPKKEELDLTAALDREIAQTIGWMRTRRHVRLSDEGHQTLKALGEQGERTWWEPLAPWLYRPHYSVNRFVAQARVMQDLARLPSTGFLGALEENRARARALEATGLTRWIVSPAGHGHYLLRQYDQSRYIGSAHAHTGIQKLVALQVRLRATGIVTPTGVQGALDGPLGRAFRDPFTGQPFPFDPATVTFNFACNPLYLSAVARDLTDSDGIARLPL